jgi:hypothetical protein
MEYKRRHLSRERSTQPLCAYAQHTILTLHFDCFRQKPKKSGYTAFCEISFIVNNQWPNSKRKHNKGNQERHSQRNSWRISVVNLKMSTMPPKRRFRFVSLGESPANRLFHYTFKAEYITLSISRFFRFLHNATVWAGKRAPWQSVRPA